VASLNAVVAETPLEPATAAVLEPGRAAFQALDQSTAELCGHQTREMSLRLADGDAFSDLDSPGQFTSPSAPFPMPKLYLCGVRNPFAQDLRLHGIFRAPHRLHGVQCVRTSLAAGKFKYAEFATRRRVCGCHFEPAPHKGGLERDALSGLPLRHDAALGAVAPTILQESFCHFWFTI
jgi:hypothetical protein